MQIGAHGNIWPHGLVACNCRDEIGRTVQDLSISCWPCVARLYPGKQQAFVYKPICIFERALWPIAITGATDSPKS